LTEPRLRDAARHPLFRRSSATSSSRSRTARKRERRSTLHRCLEASRSECYASDLVASGELSQHSRTRRTPTASVDSGRTWHHGRSAILRTMADYKNAGIHRSRLHRAINQRSRSTSFPQAQTISSGSSDRFYTGGTSDYRAIDREHTFRSLDAGSFTLRGSRTDDGSVGMRPGLSCGGRMHVVFGDAGSCADL